MEIAQTNEMKLEKKPIVMAVSLDARLKKMYTNEERDELLDDIKEQLEAYEQLKKDHNKRGQEHKQLENDYELLKDHFKFYKDTLESATNHNKILENQVIRDNLTGLYNKRHLDDEIKFYTKYAERDGRPFSLLVFDVDNFKEINDKYGHSKGDVVLKSVSDTVKKNIDERDLAFRYGGDEFVVLCPDTKESDAEKLADRLCKAVNKKSTGVSIKMGVSEYNKNSEVPIFDRADGLLYLAKALGKDCYVTESFAKTLR